MSTTKFPVRGSDDIGLHRLQRGESLSRVLKHTHKTPQRWSLDKSKWTKTTLNASIVNTRNTTTLEFIDTVATLLSIGSIPFAKIPSVVRR